MSAKETQGKTLKYYFSGKSLSCPPTPTDEDTYSRSKELMQPKKETAEKAFQFRDAFHYYAEAARDTFKFAIWKDTTDSGANMPEKTVRKDRVTEKRENAKQNLLYKTKSPVPMSELMSELNTDCSYIKNYKVVGICDNIIIANDSIINQLVAIKVIIKPANDCGKRPFFPIGIPYMVPLIRFHETNNCIFLVLKYMRKKSLHWKFSQLNRDAIRKKQNLEGNYHGCNLLAAEFSNEIKGAVLSSSVNSIMGLASNRDAPSPDTLPASCTCAVASLDDGDKTLSDISSDALSDTSDFECATENVEWVPAPEKNITAEVNDAANKVRKIVSKSIKVKTSEGHVTVNKGSSFTATKETDADNCIENGHCHINHVQSTIEKLSTIITDFHETTNDNNNYNDVIFASKDELYQNIDKSDNNSITLSVEDILRNSRELLNKVTKTLETSNTLDKLLVSFPEPDHVKRFRSNRRYESSGDLVQNVESTSKCYFNKSVSFDTSEIKNPSVESEESPVSGVSEETVKIWISQVIVALDSLHNRGIIWGNFNPSNVLFDENDRIMLTYKCFLPAAWVDNVKQRQYTSEYRLLMESYQAPELTNPLQKPTRVSDWWSVGVLLYQLLAGWAISEVHPTGITKHTEIYLPERLSMHARILLTHMLRADPRDRLGYDGSTDLKNHPFFEGITWPEDIV